MAAEPMFRIIANGDVELEAAVPDFRLAALRAGQSGAVYTAGEERLNASVRLVSAEIDKASRMGKVRLAVAANDSLKIGGFARGEVETNRRNALAIPASAVLYDSQGAYAQTLRDKAVVTKRIKAGLVAGGIVEITEGLAPGDIVILRAGAFLHDGDAVETAASAASAADAARDQVGAR